MQLKIIIIAIISVAFILTVTSAFFSARTEAINQQVVSDVVLITKALNIYHDENGFYPYGSSTPTGFDSYLDFWPKPRATGNCASVTSYNYAQKSSGEDYSLTFCLSKNTSGLNPGLHTASVRGVN